MRGLPWHQVPERAIPERKTRAAKTHAVVAESRSAVLTGKPLVAPVVQKAETEQNPLLRDRDPMSYRAPCAAPSILGKRKARAQLSGPGIRPRVLLGEPSERTRIPYPFARGGKKPPGCPEWLCHWWGPTVSARNNEDCCGHGTASKLWQSEGWEARVGRSPPLGHVWKTVTFFQTCTLRSQPGDLDLGLGPGL